MRYVKIGQIIELYNKKNTNNYDYEFYGLNNKKEFMPTVADTTGLDKKKYKIVKKNVFVFSGMQTGRDNCIRIGLYKTENTVLVSPAYTTFVIASDDCIPDYLFMYFNSTEKDRYGAFLSDGSVRSNLDWDVFCNIEVPLPSKEIQRKYIAIYEAMQHNLKVYESKMDDLKVAYVGKMETMKHDGTPKIRIGDYIKEKTTKNSNCINYEICGVKKDRTFIPTIANVNMNNLSSYKVVNNNEFAYSNRINIGSIALRYGATCLVSPSYTVFEVTNHNFILPEYLSMWFIRDEFCHYAFFYSMGSVKDELDFSELSDMIIPVPSVKEQEYILQLYHSYKNRIDIVAKLKESINNICPILIAGAMKEAR